MSWLLLPPWSIRLLATATALLVTLALARAARERRPAAGRVALLLRGLLLAGLVVVALNPTAVLPRQEEGRPRLLVLVDTSASMATVDADDTERIARARALLAENLEALQAHFTVELRSFADDSRPVELGALATLAATGRATDLAAVVIDAVHDQAEHHNQAGLVLLTDGRTTAPGIDEAARLALARSVPIWALPLGGAIDRRDLWVEVGAAETLAFAGEEIELRAMVRHLGFSNRSIPIELRQGDAMLQTIEVRLDDSGRAEVAFTVVAPQAGEVEYTVAIPPQAEEAETGNNSRPLFVRSVGGKVRVLLVEGQPHWDTKFLIHTLKRHPQVELTAINRLGPDQVFVVRSAGGEEQRAQGADAFPQTAEDFAAYDCIILGRHLESFLDEAGTALLADFVAEHGGSLVFHRGRPYPDHDPLLARLEPVIWDVGVMDRSTLALSEEGRDHPVFGAFANQPDAVAAIGPFDQVLRTRGIKPLATVLAHAGEMGGEATEDAPVVLAWQHYGQGRCVTINAGGLWRWAFHEHADPLREWLYAHFWTDLVRWLLSDGDFLGGAQISLRCDRRIYTDEQPVRFTLRTRNLDLEAYHPRLTITGPDGTSALEPRAGTGGTFTGSVSPFTTPGSYLLKLESNVGAPAVLETTVSVTSASIEHRVLSADPDLLQRLVTTSQGALIDGDDLGDFTTLVDAWQARHRLADRKHPLWDRWWWLVLLLGLAGTEWFLRRRRGLV